MRRFNGTSAMGAGSFRNACRPRAGGRTRETYDSLAISWEAVGKQLGTPSSSQHHPQDVDERGRLVALDGMPGVGDDVCALETGRSVRERRCVLVVDKERFRAADQRRRHGDGGHVVPQALEALPFAERVVAPRPGAVVELPGVVKD